MSSATEHVARSDRRCSCGASFKSRGKLRQHITAKTEPVRTVWINTAEPRQPHKKARHS